MRPPVAAAEQARRRLFLRAVSERRWRRLVGVADDLRVRNPRLNPAGVF
jgi:hypothetical protein